MRIKGDAIGISYIYIALIGKLIFSSIFTFSRGKISNSKILLIYLRKIKKQIYIIYIVVRKKDSTNYRIEIIYKNFSFQVKFKKMTF